MKKNNKYKYKYTLAFKLTCAVKKKKKTIIIVLQTTPLTIRKPNENILTRNRLLHNNDRKATIFPEDKEVKKARCVELDTKTHFVVGSIIMFRNVMERRGVWVQTFPKVKKIL